MQLIGIHHQKGIGLKLVAGAFNIVAALTADEQEDFVAYLVVEPVIVRVGLFFSMMAEIKGAVRSRIDHILSIVYQPHHPVSILPQDLHSIKQGLYRS
ncbi:hypothetical protein D3C73_1405500 [compost metagenome]